jgi:hypothetical protein
MDMEGSKLPMPADNDHIKALDSILFPPTTSEGEHLALETSYFRYWGAIGELIWAMITCCPELSFPLVKLSQFSTQHHVALHNPAVKEQDFKYLTGTLDHGLTYWCPLSHPIFPSILPPSPRLANPADQHPIMMSLMPVNAITLFLFLALLTLIGLLTYDTDNQFPVFFKLAVAAISWKCHMQPTISLSSNEAPEFLAASDAGKMAL